MAMGSLMRILVLFALILISTTANARFIQPSQNTVKSSNFCGICEEFASEAITYITENENATETQVLSILESACSKSKVDFLKEQCITYVEYYVPLIFSQIEDLSAESFCEKIKLCTDDDSTKTTTILEVQENNEENKIISEENLKSSKFCGVCEEFASEALSYISENENATETEVLSILESACSKVDYLKSQCISMVEYYVPLIFSQIDDLSAESFCEKIKLCIDDDSTKITTLVEVEELMKNNEEVMVPKDNKKDSFCKFCEKIASETLDFLQKKDTKKEIIKHLESVCSQLNYFEPQCISLVEYYVPRLIEEADDLDADDFCEKIKLCSDDVSNIISALKLAENKMMSINENKMMKITKGSSKWCSMCEEYATEAISNLAQNETETEILSTLYNACSKLDSLEKECKVMVDYYMPLLFTEIENITPETFCEKIHFCSSSEDTIVDRISQRVRKIKIASF